MVRNLWLLSAISIFILILANDPKSSASSLSGNPLAGMFTSATKGKESINLLTWIMIILFYILTIIK
jgi:protein translocase SecG subunit